MSEPTHLCKLFLAVTLCLPSALFAQTNQPAPPIKESSVTVPFIGCKSDGQLGPQAAPNGKSKSISITPQLASQLAFYEAENGPGVLAPRGWNCFGVYGSNGSSLYVTPQQINSQIVFADTWSGFAGPAIQLSVSIGDTSGRFEVAQIIARVFPAHKSFVQSVIAEGLEPASTFPFGPYPTDKLTYKNKEVVEYVTPANQEGLGTRSHLIKNADPIDGVAILSGEELNLVQLAVRLPPALSNLLPAIIHQVEQATPNTSH